MQSIQAFVCQKIPFFANLNNQYLFKAIDGLVTLAFVTGLAILIHYATKLFVIRLVRKALRQSRSIFLQVVAGNRTLNLLAPLSASLMCWWGIKIIDNYRVAPSIVIDIFRYIALFYVLISILLIISRLIWSFNDYYERRFDFASQYPIYSYIKVVTLVFWVISVLSIIAALANTSLVAIFTGIGAVSAVFLLVFKDTLLGIVSSIQVTASNIVRIGDRIAIDKYGVDGTVIDIAITTVKVQNSDNTIATIPTYSLTSEVVKNWRGMTDSGGRRIKRSINIDIVSIKECSAELISSLSYIKSVKEYIAKNQGKEIINLALYREYLLDYLKYNPQINQNFTTVIRHMDPGPAGLPLEIYTFTNDTAFDAYEQVQSDIFEHCFAALAKFELCVLQQNR